MTMDLSGLEQLTERVIGCAIAVHDELGPGLLESVYTECLMIELAANQLRVERERHVPIVYRGQTIRGRLRIDLFVEDQVIVEVKSAERSNPVFMAQLVTYLKLTGMPAGLLMNFNLSTMKAGLKRASHPDVYALKRRGQDQRDRL
jgi:GxxExxY protein